VNSSHLSREHGFHLIFRFKTFYQGEHEIQAFLVDTTAVNRR